MATDYKTICAITAAVIGAGCFVPYILDIYKSKTKPHAYTWLIWTILQVTGVIAMYYSGAGIGILALAIGSVLCGYVFVLSLKHGTKNITTFDTVCLIGALGAIGVYIFLKDPLLSIILISAIDVAGFLPTLRKSWLEPYSETVSMFAFFAISGTFTILALKDYSFTTALYPATLMAINITATIVIVLRRQSPPSSPH